MERYLLSFQELPSVLFTTQSSSGKEGSNEGRWHGIGDTLPEASRTVMERCVLTFQELPPVLFKTQSSSGKEGS
jgi:hypothetical protein